MNGNGMMALMVVALAACAALLARVLSSPYSLPRHPRTSGPNP
jgi:hypothetical protein